MLLRIISITIVKLFSLCCSNNYELFISYLFVKCLIFCVTYMWRKHVWGAGWVPYFRAPGKVLPSAYRFFGASETEMAVLVPKNSKSGAQKPKGPKIGHLLEML